MIATVADRQTDPPNYSQSICLELQLISAENRLHASHQPVFNALGARRNEFITKETEMPCGLLGLDPDPDPTPDMPLRLAEYFVND